LVLFSHWGRWSRGVIATSAKPEPPPPPLVVTHPQTGEGNRHSQDERRRLADLVGRPSSPVSPPIRLIDWTSCCQELDATRSGDLRSGGVTMHINKIHHVTTIDRVADDLGEDEEGRRE